jgi:hypothetical protein
MDAYDPNSDGGLRGLLAAKDNPHDWLRRVWVDFIGLSVVAALGGALFYLAGL